MRNHLLNKEYKIAEGEVGIADASGNESAWEKIKTTEKSEFSDNRLRSGYLYLEYDAKAAKNVIFEASGHTKLIANGMPHEGDHYDFGYTLIPMKLKKGKNTFLLTGGRFSKMRARLIDPQTNVLLTKRDMTLPDILREEDELLVGGIRVLNTSSKWFKAGRIVATINGASEETLVPNISPLNSRKIVMNIPNVSSDEESVEILVQLKDKNRKLLSEAALTLRVKSNKKHHKRTFVSKIDGSVQYYSVAPCSK